MNNDDDNDITACIADYNKLRSRNHIIVPIAKYRFPVCNLRFSVPSIVPPPKTPVTLDLIHYMTLVISIAF